MRTVTACYALCTQSRIGRALAYAPPREIEVRDEGMAKKSEVSFVLLTLLYK